MGRLTQKELEDLIKANVIDEATASRISSYYDLQKPGSSGRLNIVLGILGSLLAGIGIILLVAHNWDQFGRLTKTLLSFLPLLLGQALCAFVLLKKKGIVAWREVGASLLLFAVGASISLVSQVYHIEGSLSGFILIWLVLVVPLAYIMNSSMVALLSIAGATWHACLVGYDNESSQIPYVYLAVLIFLIPIYFRYFKRDPENNFFHLLNWTMVLSVTIVLGCFGTPGNKSYGWLFAAYLSMFCFFYLFGKMPRWSSVPRWTNPFRVVGMLGILFILLVWSFDFLWEDVMDRKLNLAVKNLYLTIFFIVPCLSLLIRNKGWKINKNTDPMGLSFIPFFVLLFLPAGLINLVLLTINLWILLVGIYFINRGASLNHLGILNFGLLLILILALCRFFDERIPFVWRGIFFLATGISFFAANYFLLNKRKKTIPGKL